jgi:hypothetical protein
MQESYLTLGKSSTDELVKRHILLYILIMMFLFQMINLFLKGLSSMLKRFSILFSLLKFILLYPNN